MGSNLWRAPGTMAPKSYTQPIGAKLSSRRDSENGPNKHNSYQRAYKACFPCRRSKSKCDPSSDPNTCSKCAREKRKCQFPEERSTRKKQNRVQAATLTSMVRADNFPLREFALMRPPKTGLPCIHDSESGDTLGQPNIQRNMADRDISQKASELVPTSSRQCSEPLDQRHLTGSRGLEIGEKTPVFNESNEHVQDEVVQTVVSTTNDARNMLFRTVHALNGNEDDVEEPSDPNIEADISSSISSISDGHMCFPTKLRLVQITEKDAQLWNQHRFVRQGWFTSQEAVTYIDA